MVRRCLFLNVAWMLAFASPLRAQTTTVAVVNASTHPAQGRKAAARIRAELNRHAQLSPLAGGELSRALELGTAPRSNQSTIDKSSTLMVEARDAMARFDYGAALVALFRAERLLMDQTPNDEIRSALADVAFQLGLVYLGQKDPANTARAFRSVRFVAPDREIDPARYPPNVVEAFRAAAPPSEVASLRITTAFDGLAVYIDGAMAGKTPLNISLPVGTHYVTVTGDLFVTLGGKANVGTDPILRLEPLNKSAAQRARALLEKHRAGALSPLALARELSEITKTAAVILIVGDKTPQVVPFANGKLGTTLSATNLAPALGFIAPPPSLQLRPPSRNVPPPTPWYRRRSTYVIGGIAAGAIASVVTTILLTSSEGTRTTNNLCFEPDCP